MPVNSLFSIFHSPLSIILLWVVFAFRPEAILPKAGSQPESQLESQPESISLEARVLALLASAGPMSKSTLSAALGQKEVSGHLRVVKLATYLQGEQKEFVLSKQVLGVKGAKMRRISTFDPSSQSVLPLSHQILATWS